MKEFNKYQLQEELKKALYNRRQEASKYIFYEDYISIEYDDRFDWIYANWKGYQTEHSIQQGWERIFDTLQTFHCSKVLNDNTSVAGIWRPESAWLGSNWLSRMKEAGLKYFAWVNSQSAMGRVSSDESIRNREITDIVQTFADIDNARRWLNSKK